MINFAEFLLQEQEKAYYPQLMDQVDQAYATNTVYPPRAQMFNAFKLCDLPEVKVVIIGQDPYHQPDQANGLAFSVAPGIKLPPSLRNIYKELHDDLGCEIGTNGDLSAWARQGVLLINNVLTVEAGKANSHVNFGWQEFTNNVIATINQAPQPVVFILWGKNAQVKKKDLDARHFVIESPHPSPLSAYRGFFGSRPFSRTNEFLKNNDLGEIDWCLKN